MSINVYPRILTSLRSISVDIMRRDLGDCGWDSAPYAPHTQTFRQVGKLSNIFLLSNEDSVLRDASPMSHPPLHSYEVGRIDMQPFPKWMKKMVLFRVQKAPHLLKEKHCVPSEQLSP